MRQTLTIYLGKEGEEEYGKKITKIRRKSTVDITILNSIKEIW